MTNWEWSRMQRSQCPSRSGDAYISYLVKIVSYIAGKPVITISEQISIFLISLCFFHFSGSSTLYNRVSATCSTFRNVSGPALCVKITKTWFALLAGSLLSRSAPAQGKCSLPVFKCTDHTNVYANVVGRSSGQAYSSKEYLKQKLCHYAQILVGF